jgi:hypothetical protein
VQIKVFAHYADSSGAPPLGHSHESSAARSEKYKVKLGHVHVYKVRMISALRRENTLNNFMRQSISKCTVALFEGLLINILILVVALVVLDKATDLTIDNAVKVADVTGSGKTTIGFVLVAFCT